VLLSGMANREVQPSERKAVLIILNWWDLADSLFLLATYHLPKVLDHFVITELNY
jgi:hypothetical protein